MSIFRINNTAASEITRFDAVGRAVRHLALTGASPVTLPVETLPGGIYMLRVTYAEGTVLRRVQLQ